MQKLQFENSWDKTISQGDREKIEKAFASTKLNQLHDIELVTLWHATNHKGDLLATAIIHNQTQQSISFENSRIDCLDQNGVIAEHNFSLPNLHIPANTSLPWTFIFPAKSQTRKNVNPGEIIKLNIQLNQ
ncbi:SLAP domain-containing protein [Aquibacillus kalidii]|uniref:SLAP domain-containing protein n=1 Tax=Aquibacillus kalidii TaxID=2762597 RepID=UPI0016461A58|nr:SLAP domain-containing protein [Aquibacillus kalidii]